MGFVGKTFAFVMFPLSILIILEAVGIYSLNLSVNKIWIGSALMIVLQIITLIMVKIHHNNLSVMNIVTSLVFISAAIVAVLSGLYNLYQKEISIIFAMTMFMEALYALN